MMKGKRMILEQGGGWNKTGRAVTGLGCPAKRTRRGIPSCAAASHGRSCYLAPDDRFTGGCRLVIFVAGALPGNKLANGRTGARHRLLVGFHLRPRSLFAHSADAQPNLLLFRS